MKRWQWYSLILMAIAIISLLFFTKERIYRFDSNYANDFNALFLDENTTYINGLNLPLIDLNLSKEDISHIENLQDLVDDFDFDNFQQNNHWRPAKMSVDQTSYPIEFRVHGKTPNGQSVGSHVSLAIRCEREIFNKKRFNLIIYERITANADRISLLGTTMNLYHQEDELVRVKINDQTSKLYYLETPIKKSFLGKRGLISFELSKQKCPIYNQLSEMVSLHEELDEKIHKSKLSKITKHRVKEAYLNLNIAIKNNDVEEIHTYFDLDYIARFQIARFLAGFKNHGFSPENLLFALDTSNFLFYPILHRDNYFGELDTNNMNSWIPYYYDGIERFDYDILRLITENKKVFQQTKNYYYSNQSLLTELITKLDAIDLKHSNIMDSGDWIDFEIFENHSVKANMETLNQWLNR